MSPSEKPPQINNIFNNPEISSAIENGISNLESASTELANEINLLETMHQDERTTFKERLKETLTNVPSNFGALALTLLLIIEEMKQKKPHP